MWRGCCAVLQYEGAGEERVPRLAPEEVQTMLDEVMMHRM